MKKEVGGAAGACGAGRGRRRGRGGSALLCRPSLPIRPAPHPAQYLPPTLHYRPCLPACGTWTAWTRGSCPWTAPSPMAQVCGCSGCSGAGRGQACRWRGRCLASAAQPWQPARLPSQPPARPPPPPPRCAAADSAGTGKGATIYVVDSGIRPSHQEFQSVGGGPSRASYGAGGAAAGPRAGWQRHWEPLPGPPTVLNTPSLPLCSPHRL